MTISDQMRRALTLCAVPFDERNPWDVVEALSIAEGIPYKVALRRMEKAADRGLIEYGTSVRGSWLTPEGKAAMVLDPLAKSVQLAP